MTQNEASEALEQRRRRTPLPLVQLFTIYVIQFTEPITATVIYPFVPQFIRDVGITGGDEKRVGYFAGIIESTFFISESLSVYHFALLSERYGRRPTLLAAPLGLAMAMIGFGLSKTFWSMVIFRFAQGVFNGNIGVSKTMIAEITDPSNMGDAFSYIPMMWVTGVITGPLLGGTFANPEVTWPNSFGRIALFRAYPYLLPCAAAALICILCLAIASTMLEESSPRHKKCKLRPEGDSLVDSPVRDYGSTITTGPQNDVDDSDEQPLSFIQLLKHPRVAITMTSYGFLAFCEMSYTALVPLVYSTSIEAGGLGLRPAQIGRIMASFAVISAFLQAVLFNRLMRRFGNRNMFILSLFGIFTALFAFPFVTQLTRRAGRIDALAGTVLAIQLIGASFTYMAYATMSVLTVDSSPSKASLSTTNGLAQMIATSCRAFAPTVASSLFSLTLQHNLLGGYFVYVVGLTTLLVAIRIAFYLPKQMQMLH